MNPRSNEDGPGVGEEDPAVALVRELHEPLVSALAKKFGDDLQVAEARDPENGMVTYQFEIHGAPCTAEITPFSGQIAVMSLNARLGRVNSGYLKALHWLGQNRAYNTLAIAYREDAAKARDLWVAANRNTLSGDAAGIRCELDDFCVEVGKAMTGLRLWFPQFVDGVSLVEFEAEAEDNEHIRFALAAPRAVVQAMEESEEAMRDGCILYCYLTRWLGAWEKNLRMLNSARMAELAADNSELSLKLGGARLRTMLALGRYQEILTDTLPKVDDSQISPSRRAALQAECLCELGQPEEALETLQSADLDDDPWVHFIRSCASIKLGRREEGAEHYLAYERMIGCDSLGRKKIAALADDNDESVVSE